MEVVTLMCGTSHLSDVSLDISFKIVDDYDLD